MFARFVQLAVVDDLAAVFAAETQRTIRTLVVGHVFGYALAGFARFMVLADVYGRLASSSSIAWLAFAFISAREGQTTNCAGRIASSLE